MTGTTSRTLRHYDAIGLLPPTYIADNGYRYYDETGLAPPTHPPAQGARDVFDPDR